MNLILRPTTAPLAKFTPAQSPKARRLPPNTASTSSRELLELDQAHTRSLFKALEGIDPLKVTTYGRASQLQSTVTWRHVQLSPHKGLADCGPVEMTFRFDAWPRALASLSPQQAQPGLYLCGSTGELVASLVPRDLQALPKLRKMLAGHASGPQPPKCPPLSVPGPLRRPGPLRHGYGPRTHQDARAFVIAERYALGRGRHLDLRASHRCTRLKTSDLKKLFQALYEYDLELGLLHGPSSFWQLHEAIVRPTLTKDDRFVLCGARCQLELELPRICEAWLVRAHHQGELIYAILFYDHTLRLDAAAILPPSSMACSAGDWKALVKAVGQAHKKSDSR